MDQFEIQFQTRYEFWQTNKKGGLLGRGTFASVKLAKDKYSGKQVAIKMIDKTSRYSNMDCENLKKEVYFHSKLDHPNIIKFVEYYDMPQCTYIVLDYAENGTLFQYLNKKIKLEENEARNYFIGAAKAVQYIHAKRVMHRDLKPENILLDKTNNVKLCDFGWCSEITKDKKRTFCGTYEYMAPEMISKQPYDQTVDIWGLGILLYELIHGYSPFKGTKPEDIQQNILKHQIVFSQAISSEVKDLIHKILKKQPCERLHIDEILNHVWCQQQYITYPINQMMQHQQEDKENKNNLNTFKRSQTLENLSKQQKQVIQCRQQNLNQNKQSLIQNNINQQTPIKSTFNSVQRQYSQYHIREFSQDFINIQQQNYRLSQSKLDSIDNNSIVTNQFNHYLINNNNKLITQQINNTSQSPNRNLSSGNSIQPSPKLVSLHSNQNLRINENVIQVSNYLQTRNQYQNSAYKAQQCDLNKFENYFNAKSQQHKFKTQHAQQQQQQQNGLSINSRGRQQDSFIVSNNNSQSRIQSNSTYATPSKQTIRYDSTDKYSHYNILRPIVYEQSIISNDSLNRFSKVHSSNIIEQYDSYQLNNIHNSQLIYVQKPPLQDISNQVIKQNGRYFSNKFKLN